MKRRRSEIFREGYDDLMRILEATTYGGTKSGVKRQIPVASQGSGIKAKWTRGIDEYPSEIELQMADGKWVRYQVVIDQPGYQGEKKPTRWQQLCNELDEVLDDLKRTSEDRNGLIPGHESAEEWKRLKGRAEEIRNELRRLRYGDAL